MKKILFCVLACMLAAVALWRADAANAVWLTDLPKAQAQAKAENKIVLLNFTGSDWCPACIELKKKVFDTKKFKTYAATNFVLVDLDYPQDHPLPDALTKANKELLAKYNSDEAYPMLVLLDADGKEIGRHLGYDSSKPQVFIDMLEKLKSAK